MAKLNTDAAFEPTTGLGAGGAIARNNLGQVYLSMGCTLNQCASVEEAEGLALLHGLREMSKYYDGPILVEVDCLFLSNALKMGATNKSSLFPIVADIKSVLAGFSSYKIGWIRRDQNKVAHSIAGRTKSSGDFVQLGSVPVDLLHVLSDDCNGSG
jgi:ribonuclease HI